MSSITREGDLYSEALSGPPGIQPAPEKYCEKTLPAGIVSDPESVQRSCKFPSVFVNQFPFTARHCEHAQDGLPGFIVAEASVAPDDFEQMFQGGREVATLIRQPAS